MAIAAATGAVTAGVAANQVINDGQISWTWTYLAFGFTLLVALLTAAAAEPSRPNSPFPHIRRGVYLRQLRASVADMETIGVVTQGEFVLRMRQVYVDVTLQPRPARDTAGDSGLGAGSQEIGRPGERRSLASFLREGRVFAVLGAPGSGKTTLARYTALALSEPNRRVLGREFWRPRRLPVLLYLRGHTASLLAEEPESLAEVAVSSPWLRDRIPAAWLRGRLDRGRCVVLLDGLDEVADEQDRKRVVGWVHDQIARYPRNTFVVTSRPYGYLSNPLTNADVLHVQRFTADQVSQFLHSWYRAIERRSRLGRDQDVHEIAEQKALDLIGRLRGQPALHDLAANPLLLTMIANVHRYRGALPGSRAALYAEMCDVLLHRRQEGKNLADPTGLTGPQKAAVMRHLAVHMMVSRQRDITSAEALRVVKEPLAEVCGQTSITPDVFLSEASKSGLLVEREQGLFAFAHLTLQEYLAAAQIKERPDDLRQLLTGNADDPWWRETSLLWAADADSTPLIEACLRAGTIRALALAFTCVDQGRQVQPAIRDRLDRMLDPGEAVSVERRRLIDGVTMLRALHNVIHLDDGTAICSQLVTTDMWTRFVRYENLRGRHTPSGDPGAITATGMLAGDAARFISWLNNLFDDGLTYRLPTPAEADHRYLQILPGFRDHTVWAHDGKRLSLVAQDAPWPYDPMPGQVARYPELILTHTHIFIRLSMIVPEVRSLTNLLTYAQVFSATPDRLPIFELISALDLAATIARARTLASQTILAGRRPDESRLQELDDIVARALSMTQHRVLTRNLTSVRDAVRSHLRPSIGGVPELVFDEKNGTLARAVDLALQVASTANREIGLNIELNSQVDLAGALDLALDHALKRHPRITLRGTFNGRAALTYSPAHADSLRDTLARHQEEPRHDHAEAYDARIQAIDRRSELEFNRDHRLRLTRALIADLGARPFEVLSIMAAAAEGLVYSWVNSSNGSRKQETTFQEFLNDSLSKHLPNGSHEDPATALQHISEKLTESGADLRVLTLVGYAKGLITRVLDRTAPPGERDIVLSVAALHAAALQLQDKSGDSNQAAVKSLSNVINTLIALTEPDEGPVANQALLLVRN
ncbi:NACHT domain-containing protein [Acrocarpospora macrocephala]|uniref:NACHT domain-containing protein n=1 Tax=Acrocarpospora macrocephala TaxID=150177 RepID=UPI0014786FE8|nr:NACHT domain-containing protein [Acrocarpospora macrocephala]